MLPFTLPRITPKSLRFAVPAAVFVIGVSGCSSTDLNTPAQSTLSGLSTTTTAAAPTKPAPSGQADATDYRRLLLTAADLSDADDTFTQRSQESQPNGSPGASAFFVNDEDTRAIIDTFLVYKDAATATATLRESSGTLGALINGSTPKPVPVGTDGVLITGNYAGQDKAATLLLFTEGRALVRLEFQSAIGDPTTDQFVTNVGKMQQIALRTGLTEP